MEGPRAARSAHDAPTPPGGAGVGSSLKPRAGPRHRHGCFRMCWRHVQKGAWTGRAAWGRWSRTPSWRQRWARVGKWAPWTAVLTAAAPASGSRGAGGWLLVQICLWLQGRPRHTPAAPDHKRTPENTHTDGVSAPGPEGTLTGDIFPSVLSPTEPRCCAPSQGNTWGRASNFQKPHCAGVPSGDTGWTVPEKSQDRLYTLNTIHPKWTRPSWGREGGAPWGEQLLSPHFSQSRANRKHPLLSHKSYSCLAPRAASLGGEGAVGEPDGSAVTPEGTAHTCRALSGLLYNRGGSTRPLGAAPQPHQRR